MTLKRNKWGQLLTPWGIPFDSEYAPFYFPAGMTGSTPSMAMLCIKSQLKALADEVDDEFRQRFKTVLAKAAELHACTAACLN